MPRRPSVRVLDISAGKAPVLDTLGVRHAGKSIEYHAMDGHKPTLDEARREIESGQRKVPEDVKVVWHSARGYGTQYNLEKLGEFPSNHFDEIHLHLMAQTPCLLDHLSEISRVLKPDGVVYSLEQIPLGHKEEYWAWHGNTGVIDRKHRELVDAIHAAGFEIERIQLISDPASYSQAYPSTPTVPNGLERILRKELPKDSEPMLAAIRDWTAFHHFVNVFTVLRKKK